MLNLHRYTIRTLIVVAAISAVFLSGCGRKTLPVAPRSETPPRITDLRYSIDQNQLKLVWTIPSDSLAKEMRPNVTVYRSKVSQAGSDCRDCPVIFNPVAEIPGGMNPSASTAEDRMTYTETLEKSFRYVYKVTLRTAACAAGMDSNYVEFDY